DERRQLPARGRDERRPRTEPAETPTDAEDARADEEPPIEIAPRGQSELRREERRASPGHEAVTDEMNGHRADHHEEQRRVPLSGEIEEPEDLRRLRHARDREPDAEGRTAGERDDVLLHDAPPRRCRAT